MTAPRVPSLTSPLVLALLACAALPLVLGCAPNRGDDDDSGPPSNSLSDALFTVIDSGAGSTLLQGRLVMVDTPTDCSELSWGGGLNWWNLASEVAFIEIYLQLGVDLDGWTQEFQTFYSWQEEGTFDYRSAAYFSGQIGTGNTGDDDDDDDDDPVEPPPPVGRDVTGQLGDSEETQGDSLRIDSYSLDTTVSGSLRSSVGNYNFSATHCGIVNDEAIVGRDHH